MISYKDRRTVMVDTQVRPSDVTKFPVIEAMLTVPRERFVPGDWREAAYAGENIELGPNRVVLEPRTMAKILDGVDITPDEVVLDVGCGLGYSAAVTAELAEAVVALEEDETMAREAEQTLAAEGVDNAVVVTGKLAEGAAQHGPYDVILIEGGVEDLPACFADQLNDGGRIACLFMEGALGVVRIGHKADGALTWRFAFNAAAPVLPGFDRAEAFSFF
jgi:protein-L-isoaspartate(D-aspartate) O-methyltransferase